MYIWKAVTAISGSAKYGAKVSDTVIIYLNAVDWEAGDAQDWMEAEMNKADTNVKANVFAIVNDDDEIELLVIEHRMHSWLHYSHLQEYIHYNHREMEFFRPPA